MNNTPEHRNRKPSFTSKNWRAPSRLALLKKHAETGYSERKYNLTIGNNPQFIWYRNAKVGTRSMLDFFTNTVDSFAVKEAFRRHYPIEHYKDHFKFAFVRNPWDRLVSGWKNKILRNSRFQEKWKLDSETYAKMRQFDYFVDYISQLDLDRCDVHFRRQSALIDLNHVDFIGRFEHLERDLLEIAAILKLEATAIPHKNKSKEGRPYQEFYSQRTQEIVGRMYRKDIQMFSYQFDTRSDHHGE